MINKINEKIKWFFVLFVILLIIFLSLMIKGLPAEFFDHFGILVFIFLFVVGILGVRTKKKLPEWIYWIILIIAMLGLLVDGWNVFRGYFLGG